MNLEKISGIKIYEYATKEKKGKAIDYKGKEFIIPQPSEIKEVIFKEIYEGKEKFPIKSVGGYSWRGNGSTSEHNQGTAIDINPNENYMIDDGRILAGSFWKPKKSKYSIPLNCETVRIMERYGFYRGFWGNRKDYMHFSYFGT